MYMKLFLFGLVLGGSLPVNALEIEGIANKSTSKVNVGEPISATEKKKPIYHYNKKKEVNTYLWMGENDEILGRGVIFTPQKKHAGNEIRLCLFKESFICSNKLLVTDEISTTPNGSDDWSISDKITNDIIFKSTDTLSLSTTLSTSSDEPVTISSTYYVVTSGDLALTSYTPYLDSFPISESKTLTSQENVGLNDLNSIELCSVVTYTSGVTPYQFSENCNKRSVNSEELIKPNQTFSYPPTVEQYKELFPTQPYLASQEVMINGSAFNFAYAPNITEESSDLEKYCSSLGDLFSATSVDETVAHLGSDTFNDSWPKETNYWTKEEGTPAFVAPGITWSSVVIPSGDNKLHVDSAPNELYYGFFLCKSTNL
ncbi:hypothetical protein [Vibrio sp. 10N.261.46.A3]|uniref:hypothetical protein n=1 Tax=Vibrio sp. 10N.261.46.A3 TaxID=3229658 RepID=UPI00354FDBA7